MSLLTNMAFSVGLGVLGTAGAALGLIAFDRPAVDLRAGPGGGLDFTVAQASAARPPALQSYSARDGTALGFRRWDSGVADVPLVVAVHGSGWHGAQFAGLGLALAQAGLADVVAPDLRGHGPAPQRRGDVDYIGQFEDDLADLIVSQARPGQQVVLLGHSSGGGLVIRYAGGQHGATLAGAVLLAPFVQHDAPTARPDAGGWARVLTRRVIGLAILNAVGVRALNHLPVIQFRFPASVLDGPLGGTATRAYSYRLNTGFAPRRDWGRDVAALPPYLLVAGARDEAFVTDAYAPALAPHNPGGTFVVLDGVGHLGVVDAPATFDALRGYLETLG